MTLFLIIAPPLIAGVLCAILIVLLRPLLQRYALARPNARSSHSVPTPQGGGAAVVVACVVSLLVSAGVSGLITSPLLFTIFAAILLAVAGAYDDLRSMSVLPRLLLQSLAVGIVLASLPENFRLLSFPPTWAERTMLLVAGLWFVNLVNFMDGLDWITVAEVVPVTAALALFGTYGQLPLDATIVALALCGAMIGFAPFNKPVAKLFLGDVGSLPIGLLMGWCLLELAGRGHLLAALLLPLYYLADATLTLLRRLIKGEAVWVAHRSHFYQQATDNGFSVMHVVSTIIILNVALAAFAAITMWQKAPLVQGLALVLGASGVALVLIRFSRPRSTLNNSTRTRF